MKLRNLERLVITGTSAADLRPLAELKHLKQLLIWDAPHVSDLSFLAPMRSLQMLALTNFPGVRDSKPLEHLHSLKAFGFDSTAESNLKLKVASLAPLSALGALQYLSLVGLRIEDHSLTPLCSWFEYLDMLGSLKRLQGRSLN